MNIISWVREGIAQRRAAIYMKVMAVFFCLAALSHLASIMGLGGGSGVDTPWYFRAADPVLLLANLVIAWGLWRTKFWSVVGWLAAVVFLQAVPMLLLMQFAAPDPRLQATWYGMMATHAVLLAVFFALLRHKKPEADLRDRARPE
jgi:hypothetical protein